MILTTAQAQVSALCRKSPIRWFSFPLILLRCILDFGFWIFDFRFWKLEIRNSKLELELESGIWNLKSGICVGVLCSFLVLCFDLESKHEHEARITNGEWYSRVSRRRSVSRES